MDGKALSTGFPLGNGFPLPSHPKMTAYPSWWAVSSSSLQKGRWCFTKHLRWYFLIFAQEMIILPKINRAKECQRGYQAIHGRWARESVAGCGGLLVLLSNRATNIWGVQEYAVYTS